ncbi:MAG: hypothetical protein ACRCXM_03250 [Beijerinckiaceae bacterium]
MTDDRQARPWVLALCAGLLAAALAPSPVQARKDAFNAQTRTAMTFTPGRLAESKGCGRACADFIVADGMIGLGSSFSYLVQHKLLGERTVPILLDSPGGNLLGSEMLAQMWRKLGVTVIVARARERMCGLQRSVPCNPQDQIDGVKIYDVSAAKAECESACPFAMMGGTVRIVPAGARIGLHAPELDTDNALGSALQAIDPDIKKNAAETDYEDMASIAREMGVDEAIVTRALKTPHKKMDYISADDIRAYRLTTTSLEMAGLPPALVRALSPATGKGRSAGGSSGGALTPRQRP